MQRCRVRGYHRHGREQGNTANNRDWDYVSMGLISAPQTMYRDEMHFRWASFGNQLGQTHSRTAPRGYIYIMVGTIRSPHCPHHFNRNIIYRIILQEAQHY